MPEKTPVTKCPDHNQLLVHGISGSQVQVYCPAQGCALNWVFALPLCGYGHCSACDAKQIMGVPCRHCLEVTEIYADGTAWAQCPHSCRATSLIATPLSVPAGARIIQEPAVEPATAAL